MKRLVFLALAFIVAQTVIAQVTVRNDFVITGKHQKKIKNKGLTFVSINPAQRHGWNYIMNVRGIIIDLDAIRHPRKKYSYTQIAEKVYVPTVTSSPAMYPVPLFLLMPPPHVKMPAINFGQRTM
ncbi:MAG TPA: hypothetical protein VIT44_04785 [Cyclobacteriaceae bacterium]